MSHRLPARLLAGLLSLFAATPLAASAAIFVSVSSAPPPLPYYVQPPCPQPNYEWIPGYYAYGDDGYYWVEGYWAPAPEVGYYWTPGYWIWNSGYYVWHGGYWGPRVGYYGGVNYGYGYYGNGFVGGIWQGRTFRYNTAILNVDRSRVRNVYVDRMSVRSVTRNRPSFANRPSYAPGTQTRGYSHPPARTFEPGRPASFERAPSPGYLHARMPGYARPLPEGDTNFRMPSEFHGGVRTFSHAQPGGFHNAPGGERPGFAGHGSGYHAAGVHAGGEHFGGGHGGGGHAEGGFHGGPGR